MKEFFYNSLSTIIDIGIPLFQITIQGVDDNLDECYTMTLNFELNDPEVS